MTLLSLIRQGMYAIDRARTEPRPGGRLDRGLRAPEMRDRGWEPETCMLEFIGTENLRGAR